MADRWLARWLAETGRLGELRQRAARGSYPALHELAEWLASHERMDELRRLVTGHREPLAAWLARDHRPSVIRLAAGLGDAEAQARLDRWLARRAGGCLSGRW